MRKSQYRVVADVLHLDGPLAGIESPRGHAVSFPSKALARKHQRFLAKVRDEKDFLRQPITGNRIQVCGPVIIELHMADEPFVRTDSSPLACPSHFPQV